MTNGNDQGKLQLGMEDFGGFEKLPAETFNRHRPIRIIQNGKETYKIGDAELAGL